MTTTETHSLTSEKVLELAWIYTTDKELCKVPDLGPVSVAKLRAHFARLGSGPGPRAVPFGA